MASADKRTISLPTEHAAYIDQLIANGSYASASEVVRAGLRALQERDAAVERWLNEEVASTYDAMKTSPERGHSVDSVFTEIRQRALDRKKESP